MKPKIPSPSPGRGRAFTFGRGVFYIFCGGKKSGGRHHAEVVAHARDAVGDGDGREPAGVGVLVHRIEPVHPVERLHAHVARRKLHAGVRQEDRVAELAAFAPNPMAAHLVLGKPASGQAGQGRLTWTSDPSLSHQNRAIVESIALA